MLAASRRNRNSRGVCRSTERVPRGADAEPHHAAEAAASMRTVPHGPHPHHFDRVEAVAQKHGGHRTTFRINRTLSGRVACTEGPKAQAISPKSPPGECTKSVKSARNGP